MLANADAVSSAWAFRRAVYESRRDSIREFLRDCEVCCASIRSIELPSCSDASRSVFEVLLARPAREEAKCEVVLDSEAGRGSFD